MKHLHRLIIIIIGYLICSNGENHIFSSNLRTLYKNITFKIDSLENVIEGINNGLIYSEDYPNAELKKRTLERKKLWYRQSLSRLSSTTELYNIVHDSLDNVSFYEFRDTILNKNYLRGYNNPANAVPSESLYIHPKKGIACNTGFGKTIYGFVNLHDRKSRLRVDFEKFSRIGIYSIFPEKFGSIEMIFSENKTIEDKNIKKYLVKQAQRYNTKVDIVLSFFNWDSTNYNKPHLNQNVVMLNMVDSLSAIIKEYKFDGITVDFDIDNMNIDDIFKYKEFILRMHNSIKTMDRKVNINIIISAKDILDTTTNIYKFENPPNTTPSLTIKTKLDLLLKPDHVDYIDLVLINLDFSYLINKNNYSAVSPFRDSIGIKQVTNTINSNNAPLTIIKDKAIGVLPLYGYCWSSFNSTTTFLYSFTQNNFPEKMKLLTFNNDFKLFKDDSTLFLDDLSNDALSDKVQLIHDSFFGIGLWNVEYGNSHFYEMLHSINLRFLDTLHSPRILMIRYGHSIRAFMGPNKVMISVILLVLITVYLTVLIILHFSGHDNFIHKYRLLFIISGIVLSLFSITFFLAIPKLEVNTLSKWFIYFAIANLLLWIFFKIIRISKANDLP